MIRILLTCLSVIPLLLKKYPEASFGFIGARGIDKASNTVEGYRKTQRFRVYRTMVNETVGPDTFEHFEYEDVSGYLLINRLAQGISKKERLMKKMFSDTYTNLLDV